ncbi:Ubiquitin [Gracilaria domingensis]|nr:Ubiquitin [Gracilaria domingensis]
MMALRTAKQRDEESAEAKSARLRAPHKSLAEMRAESSAGAAASSCAKTAPSSVQTILGDHPVEGIPSVLLIHGRQKYRFNVQLSDTVFTLKEKASTVQPMQSHPSNMRLLFKGKFLADEHTLEQVGAKCGSSFMLLFNAKHHDAVEDKQQISSIDDNLRQLEAKANALASQVEHRLLDTVDVAVKKTELNDTLHRLKDNLSSVRSEDQRRASMEQRLQTVEHIISRL